MILIKLTDLSTRNPIYINIEQIGYINSQIVDKETTTVIGIAGTNAKLSVIETPDEIIAKLIEIRKQMMVGGITEYLLESNTDGV
jgi:hypothetical protein